MKKIKISETQLRKIIAEMAYPISFNIDTFRHISTYLRRIAYCKEHLYRIGQGTSRIVFAIDDDKVLKLAKNRKGLAQNEAEYNTGRSGYHSIFAEVFNADDNYQWIEMELANKAKLSDFKRILGVDFKTVCRYILFIHSWYSRRNTAFIYNDEKEKRLFNAIANEELDCSEWFISLQDYMGDYQLETVGDLMRISSWGIVTRNGSEELVLVDYGLNENVYDTYYK